MNTPVHPFSRRFSAPSKLGSARVSFAESAVPLVRYTSHFSEDFTTSAIFPPDFSHPVVVREAGLTGNDGSGNGYLKKVGKVVWEMLVSCWRRS